jgi:hypothetical protein
MVQIGKIGEEAREMDQMSFKDRLKIGRRSITKIFAAFLFYIIMMGVFFYIL